jgi:hypothetical protein
VAIFVLNLKHTIGKIDKKSLIKLGASSKEMTRTTTAYADIERVERTEKLLKIYFNFKNPTDDILNIPKLEEIALNVGATELRPQKITDRQGKIFVQKILSHTQNFGILIFPPSASDRDQASLTWNGMFLETNPDGKFSQKIELNLKELSQPAKVRN